MVKIPYDSINHQYFGEESIELIRGSVSVEDEEAIAFKKQQKLDELKKICRFCLCLDPKDDSKCVLISKLDDYSISLDELLASLGLASHPELFGDVVCEQCFQQIVEIDLFKKKCREAQDEVLTEIQELENKILEIRKNKPCGNVWYKNEMQIPFKIEEPQLETMGIEILEEHLVDDDNFEEAKYEIQSFETLNEEAQEYIEEIQEGYKIIYQQLPDQNIGDEKMFNVSNSEIVAVEETCQTIDIQLVKSEEQEKTVGVDEYQVVTTDDIIKNPERNRFCFRIYECFFCKMVRKSLS